MKPQYDQHILEELVKPDEYYIQTRPEMLPYISESAKQILEIGCGNGYFGKALKERQDCTLTGIEYDVQTAETAKQVFDTVHTGKVEDHISALPKGSFDAIVCNDVLEHLVDPYTVLTRLQQTLTPDGVIVASIPNVRYITNLYEVLVQKNWQYKDAGILDKTHYRFFTKRSIIESFETLGYEIVSIEGINSIKSWKFTLFNILTLGFFDDTRHLQFAVVARKKKQM